MTDIAADDIKYDRLLWLAAGLSAIAGIVHLVVSPQYLDLWWGYGFFFICAGVAQIAYALAIFVRPLMAESAEPFDDARSSAMRKVYLAGAAGNAAIIALYIITRTVGIPLVGPAANIVEPVTPVSLMTTAAELILVVILLRLARQSAASDVGAS